MAWSTSPWAASTASFCSCSSENEHAGQDRIPSRIRAWLFVELANRNTRVPPSVAGAGGQGGNVVQRNGPSPCLNQARMPAGLLATLRPKTKIGSPSSDEPVLRDAPADEAPGNAADGSQVSSRRARQFPRDSVVWIVDNLQGARWPPSDQSRRQSRRDRHARREAVQFNGADALFVGNQPIAGLPEMDGGGDLPPGRGGGAAQRWFHMQAGGADSRPLRASPSRQRLVSCQLRSVGKRDRARLCCRLPHPLGAFYHVAIVVDASA